MNDFYVGYLPKAPTALAGFVRKVIVVLGLVVGDHGAGAGGWTNAVCEFGLRIREGAQF